MYCHLDYLKFTLLQISCSICLPTIPPSRPKHTHTRSVRSHEVTFTRLRLFCLIYVVIILFCSFPHPVPRSLLVFHFCSSLFASVQGARYKYLLINVLHFVQVRALVGVCVCICVCLSVWSVCKYPKQPSTKVAPAAQLNVQQKWQRKGERETGAGGAWGNVKWAVCVCW